MLALQLFENWIAGDFRMAGIPWGFFIIFSICLALAVLRTKDMRFRRLSYLAIVVFFVFITCFIYVGIDKLVRFDVETQDRAREERALAEQTFTQELFPDISWHGEQINFTTGQCYVSVFVEGSQMRVVVLDPALDNTSHSQVLAGPPSESASFVQGYCPQR